MLQVLTRLPVTPILLAPKVILASALPQLTSLPINCISKARVYSNNLGGNTAKLFWCYTFLVQFLKSNLRQVIQ